LSIISYKSLFGRFARSLAAAGSGPKSKRLKFETAGAPTVYLGYTIEDWDLASPAAGALAGCGVDIFPEWTSAQLFKGFDDDAENRLQARLGLDGSWLVVLISERTPQIGRIPWVLELARDTMPPSHYAILPVRYGPDAWSLPQFYEGHPRIEELGDDLCVMGLSPDLPRPLSQWLRLRVRG
jgi:hypothetical protein